MPACWQGLSGVWYGAGFLDGKPACTVSPSWRVTQQRSHGGGCRCRARLVGGHIGCGAEMACSGQSMQDKGYFWAAQEVLLLDPYSKRRLKSSHVTKSSHLASDTRSSQPSVANQGMRGRPCMICSHLRSSCKPRSPLPQPQMKLANESHCQLLLETWLVLNVSALSSVC
jgi:hypothetical protein